MWRIAAIIFAVCWIGSIFATSILRGIIDKRRERTRGIGGTQDIAMWGTLFGLASMIGALVCTGMWLATHR